MQNFIKKLHSLCKNYAILKEHIVTNKFKKYYIISIVHLNHVFDNTCNMLNIKIIKINFA